MNRKKEVPEYRVWRGMIGRCTRPSDTSYPRYGGRGIRICAEWRKSFAAFIASVGPRPTPKHWIERIDADGHYEPGNVRWATIAEQARNRSNTRRIEFCGERLCVTEWAARTGIHADTIRSRIRVGWTAQRALSSPARGGIHV